MANDIAKVGDRVVITEGSLDGHTGEVIEVKPNGRIRVRRDVDHVEVDVPFGSYVIDLPKKVVDYVKELADKKTLREQCMEDTLNEICELVGYQPDHNKEFSGDKLIEILKARLGK